LLFQVPVIQSERLSIGSSDPISPPVSAGRDWVGREGICCSHGAERRRSSSSAR
jgi:hypothetical protein